MATYNMPYVAPSAAAVGSRVAQVSKPDPFADLSAVMPNLGQINKTASNDLMAQLSGQLSPGTLNTIQNAAASWGVGAGVPGSDAQWFKGLETLGLNAENQVNQGLRNYSSVIPTVSGTQTVSPALQYEIGLQNATNAAAPDPVSSADYSQQLYNAYLTSIQEATDPTAGDKWWRGVGKFPIVESEFTPSKPAEWGIWY